MSPYLLLSLTLITLHHFQSISAQTVSIQDEPSWSSQRTCALNCMDGIDGAPSILAEDIGCPTDPVENTCFCRSDLQDNAESIIRNCLDQYCQAALDVNSAVSLYDAYCTSNGFMREVGAVTAGTIDATAITGSSSQSSTLIGAISTQTKSSISSSSTPTSSSNNSSGGGSSLKTTDIVGIVVGILGFIVTAIGAWFGYKALRNRP